MAPTTVKHFKRGGKWHTIHTIEKTLKDHVVEWVATVLSATAAILNSNIFGIDSFNTYFASFFVFFVADILWVGFSWKHKHWGVFVTFAVFGVINGLAILKNFGIWNW